MKMSKILIAALAVLWLSGQVVFGQWTTSGNNIYNTNSGNVGIGLSNPTEMIEVAGGSITLDNGQSYMIRRNASNAKVDVMTIPSGTDNLQLKIPGSSSTNLLNVVNTGGTPRFTITGAGNVGIGTTAPQSLLHIKAGSVLSPGIRLEDEATGAYTTLKYGVATEEFRITRSGTGGPNIAIQSDGDVILAKVAGTNIGIGTENPTHKLSVNGDITAEEVVVVPDVAPDFVFEDDYALRSLEEVAQYIDAHGHLPEIPSAAEMQAEGVGLSTMQMKLLQKIEELTLYLIEQNKVLADVQEENTLLKQRLTELEAAGN